MKEHGAKRQWRDVTVYSLLAAILLFFLTINYLTPVMGEDYVLIAFPPKSPPSSVFAAFHLVAERIHQQMTGWNVRLGEQLSIVFSAFPPIVFDVCNAVVALYYLYLVCLYAYAGGAGREKTLWCVFVAFATVVLFQPVLGEIFFWRTGSTNYLWTICILLTFSYPVWCLCYGKRRDVIKNSPYKTAALTVLGFFAGMTNENTIPVFWVLYVIVIVCRGRRGEKNPLWLYTSFLSLTAGYIFLLKATSTAIRVAYYRELMSIPDMRLLDHLRMVPTVIYRFWHDNTGLILLSSACILCAVIIELTKKGSAKNEGEKMRMEPLALLLLSSLSCGALIMSPYIETRAFLLPDFLMTVCVAYYSERCLSALRKRPLYIASALVLGVCASICALRIGSVYSDYHGFCAQRDAEIAVADGEYQWGVYPGPYVSRILTTREDYIVGMRDNIAYYYSKDVSVTPELILNGDLRTDGYSVADAVVNIDWAEYHPAEGKIALFGWGTIPGTASAKNEQYLFIGDEAHKIYYKLAWGQERPDVAAVLGDSRQLHTGFSLNAVLPKDFSMTEDAQVGFCVVNREEKLCAELTHGTVEAVFGR